MKKVGYGPILEIRGNRIKDMRTLTYYRIEGEHIYEEGGGIRYSIYGNQIKDTFGGYMYELSGSNINKVFGGFYASISGSYITKYDNSEKYEVTCSLNKSQTLLIAILVFGKQ